MTLDEINERLNVRGGKMPRTKSGSIDGNLLLARMKENRLPSGSGFIKSGDEFVATEGSVPLGVIKRDKEGNGVEQELKDLVDISGIRNPETGKVFRETDMDFIDPPDGLIDGRYMYADMGGEPWVEKDWSDGQKVMKKMFSDGLEDVPDDQFVGIARERLEEIVRLTNARHGKEVDSMENIDKTYKPKNFYDYKRLAERYSKMLARGKQTYGKDMPMELDPEDQQRWDDTVQEMSM